MQGSNENIKEIIEIVSILDYLELNQICVMQHAVSQSEVMEARHTIPAYTAQAHYPRIHCEN